MTTTSTKPSVAFWIISVLALVWNLMGVMAFITQLTMSPEVLQALPAEQQALYTNIPMWATVAFAVAVFGSTIGCILLLLRKRLAVPVLSISFAAILVQMVHSLVISKSIEVYGPGGMIMPLMIIFIGGFLIWYSRKAAAMGWLS
jgi:hypothetical protein